jgi:hypothetical protein
MKTVLLVRAFFFAIVIGVCCANLAAQTAAPAPQQPAAPAPPVHKHDMESHDSPSAPSPAHEKLMRLAGDYTTAGQFFYKPGEKPIESTGTATLTPTLGGRFLMEQNSGSMMGQPVEGTRLYGYNNGTGKYEGVWFYTSSTAIMNLSGSSSDDGKTIVYTATYDDDRGGHRTVQVTMQVLDNDSFRLELSGKNPDGSQGPLLRETYTRKK